MAKKKNTFILKKIKKMLDLNMFSVLNLVMNEMMITKHFVERFNQRYMKTDYHWKMSDLKSYMKKILKDSQLRHLENRKYLQKPQYIHFGNNHCLIIRNNTFITIYNKRSNI